MPRIQNGERIVSSTNVAEETGIHMQENESGPVSYAIHRIYQVNSKCT